MVLRGIVSNPVFLTEPRVVFHWKGQINLLDASVFSHVSNRRQKGFPISPTQKNISRGFYSRA